MIPKRKRDGFKEWLSGFLAPKDKIRGKSDGSPPQAGGSQPQAVPGGFISHAQGFTVNNSTMTAIQGNQYNVEGDRNIVPKIMKLLSQQIIQGAAHDSSARTPPPRCHPDTRVKLITDIIAWFESQELRELLLWVTGPAGVGKSAIVQTFAEYLAKSKSLGASVFISRPNGRNNPHGIFITIAYQLATRIEAYCDFIVERLSRDPELLHGDMQAQFTTFIIEPFVGKRIGAGGKRWSILLDGLDELQGEDAQCNIIQLISAFAHDHPDIPLAWIIASRPESRISNTFNDPTVSRSCRTEYIPIDSTEACEDVERFLRSSFNTIQKDFRDSVPNGWPSDTDFLKVTAAASGLFVYAEVVMRFIRDPDYADPASRFEVLLSVIDRSTATSTQENPFVHLDALYHEILSSIPSAQWSITKRLLGPMICSWSIPPFMYFYFDFATPSGMSILFSLPRHTVFACLIKCRSTLRIPDREAAHEETFKVLHASFADYLKDPGRSGNFHVGNIEDVVEDVTLNILTLWNECSGDDIATASVESTWLQYRSKLDDKTPSTDVTNLRANLFRGTVHYLARIAGSILETPVDSLAYVQLCKVHMAKLCYYLYADDLAHFAEHLVNDPNVSRFNPEQAPPMFKDTILSRETQLKELKFGHFDWKEMNPANVHKEVNEEFHWKRWILDRPGSNAELEAFVSKLECLQKHSPELKVVIFGGVPKWRVAVFRCRTESKELRYVIPYPE